jgi:hypothetical protein
MQGPTWEFNIDDKLSAPAKNMGSALTSVDKALAKADASMRALDKTLDAMPRFMEETTRAQKDQASALTAMTIRAEKAAEAQKKLRAEEEKRAAVKKQAATLREFGDLALSFPTSSAPKATSPFGGGLFGTSLLSEAMPAVFVVQQLAGAITSLGAAAAGAAIEASKFAIEQASYKRSSLAALEIMTGSKAGATDLFDKINSLADVTPMTGPEVMRGMRGMMGAGLNFDESKTMFAALSDVESAQGSEGKGSAAAIQAQLVQALGKGKFDMEDLKVISSQSGGLVNIGHVIDTAARLTGKTAKQIRDDGLDARTGLAAFRDTVKSDIDKGGLLGEVTKKLGDSSLNVQLSTLGDRFGRLFGDVNFDPILGALKNLNELLDPTSDSAKRLKAAFEDLFNNGFKAFFDQYSGPDGMKQLRSDFERLVVIAERFASALEAAATAGAFVFDSAKVAALGAGPNTSTGENIAGHILGGSVRSAVGNIPVFGGGAIAAADALGIGQYADGGYIDRPTIALVGEAGPEWIVPQGRAGSGGGRGDVNVSVTVHANSEHAHDIARRVREELQTILEQLSMQAGAA